MKTTEVDGQIELHDSELLNYDARTGLVSLNAYVHRRNKATGGGEGGVQRVHLLLNQVNCDGSLGELPATILESKLHIDGHEWNELIPLPSGFFGQITLALMLYPDARWITFSGQDLTIRPIGDYRFVELTPF